jgi:peptide/nickel transport system substrate-binding protein
VKWNLEHILNPDVNSPQRGQLEPAIERVEAVDKTTLRLILKKQWRPLLAALGERPGFVISPTAAEKYGDTFGRNPVGSGPFKFVEWVDDSHIIRERFEDYWDKGKPYLDRIEIRHVPDIQVQATMVRTGEAHLIDSVDPSVVATLRGAPGIVVEEYNSWRWYATQCDVDKPPFDNPDLRKALAYATDRETIKKVIFNDTGRVMTHPIAGGWAYDPSLDNLMTFDLDRAREHLEKSGMAGQTFKLTASNDRLIQDFAQLLQAQYQELGITVEIETVDAAESFKLVKEDKTNWTITNWTPRADPDGLLRILWHSKGFQNTTGFSNPEVDRLLDEAAGTYDTKEAAELYHQVEQIIVENADHVFIHAPAEFAARREEVMGFQYYPDLILRLRELWLKQ